MITLYTKYGCPQCDMTKRVLDGEGIEYTSINVEDDAEALDYVKNNLGFSSMPVVVKDGEEPFSGFRPDMLLNFS
ncbi:glutaredoxin-like protein NrdH [Alkalihalophilus pseudofirmus]|uniref:glutaredoxin-like protein NrdH n=1 Tax=Alkalihalophilus pseudofirmus TaxID=79885 RepID=UPI00259B4EA6|nr:glutaredoxin-like protein NrdH [Alkalihalophilus pseudofirmus]WEG18668.1 glutaredoxin-like protein NrdH [Alkalihalophilus pseudofirmus]